MGSFWGVAVLHRCSWSNAEKLVVSIRGSRVGLAPRKLLLRESSSSEDDLSRSLNRPLFHGSVLGSVGISLIRQRDYNSQVCVTTSRDLTPNP